MIVHGLQPALSYQPYRGGMLRERVVDVDNWQQRQVWRFIKWIERNPILALLAALGMLWLSIYLFVIGLLGLLKLIH